MDTITTRDLQIRGLTDMKDVGNTLELLKVAVFMNNITPGRNTTLEDLEVCTVAGLSLEAATSVSAPFEEGDGVAKVAVSAPAFIATTDVGLPVTLMGVAVINEDGDTLLSCALFPTPIVCTQIGDGVAVSPRIPFGS